MRVPSVRLGARGVLGLHARQRVGMALKPAQDPAQFNPIAIAQEVNKTKLAAMLFLALPGQTGPLGPSATKVVEVGVNLTRAPAPLMDNAKDRLQNRKNAICSFALIGAHGRGFLIAVQAVEVVFNTVAVHAP